jgi:hypothetical protein
MSDRHWHRFANSSLALALVLLGVAALLGLPVLSHSLSLGDTSQSGAEGPGVGPVSGARTAAHVYVRTDGHDTLCNGTANAPYPGSGGPGLNCAFATVQKGVDSVGAGGTVHVAAGTYTENVTVSQDLALQGAGVGNTIVDGGASGSVFSITYAAVSISDVTIRNGSAPWGGGVYVGGGSSLALKDSAVVSNTATWGAGGIYNLSTLTINDSTVAHNVAGEGGGGGIYNAGGSVTISNSTVVSNRADNSGGGGGIYNGEGTLTILNSAFVNNTADDEGGGIASWGGTLTIRDSAVSENQAKVYGGGLFNDSTAELTNVTVSSNTSDDSSGGIHNQEVMTLTNATVSGNTASYGGGILNTDVLTLTVINSTIADNNVPLGSDSAGGIHNYGNVTFQNSILAYNQKANCWDGVAHGATLTSNGYNLDSGTTCGFSATGDIVSTDPMLGPLADNGGPATGAGQAMLTHALLSGSPAIDAGTNVGCPSTDQRGVARPVDGDEDGTAACDIGAYEYKRSKVFLPIILSNR